MRKELLMPRKSVPTALKVLAGVRKDRINDSEPAISLAIAPKPPGWLDGVGQEHWMELVAILEPAGVLTAGDLPALAMLCDDYAIVRRSVEGSPIADAGDYESMRAMLSNADKARDRYRRMLIEFGLTPSSRSRLKMSAVAKPRDKLEEFLSSVK
jgi:P27 family predicted phage terminase small subunit